MGLWGLSILILCIVGIPLVIWAGLKLFRRERHMEQPSNHPGRPDHVHCPYCGEKNPGNATHCEKCGRPLGGVAHGR